MSSGSPGPHGAMLIYEKVSVTVTDNEITIKSGELVKVLDAKTLEEKKQ